MVVDGWSRRHAAVAVSMALLWACGTHTTKTNERLHRAGMTESSRAVEEGIERQIVPPAEPAAARRGPTPLADGEPIWLQTGKSRVLYLAKPVRRVSIGDPDLAGIVVLGPRAIMINAKPLPRAEGGIMMAAAPRAGVVTGRTLTPEPRFSETTLSIWSSGDEVPSVHSLFVADFIDQQVMLEVTVAELNRTAMEQHGIDFRQIGNSFVSAYFMGGGFGPAVPGLSTTVPPTQTPLFPLTLSNDPNKPTFAFQLPKEDITAFIALLKTEGLATVLAQPKLLAMSGQNAVFQVGGEIPIRIVTSFVADIQFKPFGTLVNFLPRVSEEGDIILTVTPEVSQPDFNSRVEDIPTFLTRRASTSVRLRNGETLVVGGLLQTIRRERVRGVPYLMDIPGIGYIFRDTTYEDQVTELLVVVTPRLVRPMAPGTQLALPTDRGPFTMDDVRTVPEDAEVTRPRVPGVLLP